MENATMTFREALEKGLISLEIYDLWLKMKRLQKISDLIWEAMMIPRAGETLSDGTQEKILAAYEAATEDYWKASRELREAMDKEGLI